MEINKLKIAHISDLHVWKISYDLAQFFSKRWIGNLNLILYRRKKFQLDQLLLLIDIFKKEKIDYVLVTGDISSTSLDSEFSTAKAFFDRLNKEGIKTLFVPGNHDKYTKSAHKNMRFFKYFSNPLGRSNIEKKYLLEKEHVQSFKLGERWWAVALDTALSTHLLSSRGEFNKKAEKNLDALLKDIPNDENVIIFNHFPFKKIKSPRKALKRASFLKEILKRYPNIQFFLHGHTHNHKIQDMREKGLPIILDSGSTGHNSIGKWNLLEIDNENIDIGVYSYNRKTHHWKKTITQHLNIK